MKKIMILGLLTGILIAQPGQLKSTHIMGSDMTWSCIGQDSFIISLTLYRDCNGVNLVTAMVVVNCVSTSQRLQTLSIPKPSPEDITPTCASSCTRCGSSSCSFPYGVEKYTYQKLLVLDNAGSCCKISMSWTSCCRNTTITTGMASNAFWCEATFDRCLSPCDNSPQFSNPPILITCMGQDIVFNHGVTDFDRDPQGGLLDSLSYEWVYPRGSGGSNLIYTGQYDYDQPIYFWGFPNTNLNAPRGFHLDPYTGVIDFRPMKVEQTVMAMKVTEYRNGVNIGEITRDIQIIVISCPNNQAPLLSGPFYKEVCAGTTVTFNVRTMDYDPNDTLSIGWNKSIPGAIWTDNNGQAKHPTGILTWTPGEQDASNLPYVFTATVKDDKCPINGQSTRAYQILVKPLPKAEITVADSGCGDYYLSAQPIVGAAPSYQWIGNFNPGFNYTGSAFLYKFNRPGPYPFSMIMTAGKGSLNCSRTYFDTINVDTSVMVIPMDDREACQNEQITLKANLYYSRNTKYQWNSSSADSFQEKSLIVTRDTTLIVQMESDKGCKGADTVFIKMLNQPAPNIYLGNDTSMTSRDSLTLDAGPGFKDYLWDDLSNKQKRIIIGKNYFQGQYTFHVRVTDTNNCSASDTILISILPSGLDEERNRAFKLYPNPTSGMFFLETDKSIGKNTNIRIFNAAGKILYTSDSQKADDKSIYPIDFSDQAEGIYLIEIIQGREVWYFRLVKH